MEGKAGEGGILLKVRPETAEELAALSTKELLARRAPYDAAILARAQRFFEMLNQWLPTVNQIFEGIENVLTVLKWEPSGSNSSITYKCKLGISAGGQLTEALLNALTSLGVTSVSTDFPINQISLTFPADFLGIGSIGALVEYVRVEREAEETRRQRPRTGGQLPGPEVADVTAGVQGAVAIEVDLDPGDGALARRGGAAAVERGVDPGDVDAHTGTR